MADIIVQDDDVITEIEKVLGAKEGDRRGQQIGKALSCLQKLDQEGGAMGLIQEIEKVLKGAVVPSTASEVARLFHSLKLIAQEKAQERAKDQLDKAYVEYAKGAATAYATVFNAVNMFGTTLSFVIRDDKSDMLSKHPHIRGIFVAMTLAFLPVSMLTAGMSHALTHKLQWKRKVAIMHMVEVIYMMVMCILFGIYLMYNTNGMAAALCTCVGAAGSLIAIPCCVFKTPFDLLAWCHKMWLKFSDA